MLKERPTGVKQPHFSLSPSLVLEGHLVILTFAAKKFPEIQDLDTFLEMHEFELHLSCSHVSPRFVEDFSPFLQHLLHADTSTSLLGMTLDSSSSVVNFAHPGAVRSAKRKKHIPPRELTYPTWRKRKIIVNFLEASRIGGRTFTVLPKFMRKCWVCFFSPRVFSGGNHPGKRRVSGQTRHGNGMLRFAFVESWTKSFR